MEYWGRSPQPVEEIHSALYRPELHGVLASELAVYLQSRGFQTQSFSGQWQDLVTHVAGGRPLLVSLEVNSRGAAQHYVLVTGVDEAREIVFINDSAARKLLPVSRAEFEKRWAAMSQWTLLAIPSDGSSPAPRLERGSRTDNPEFDDDALEAASEAFRAGDLQTAKRLVHQSDPAAGSERVRNELLATAYFLEDNLEAAVKYWNRNDAPRVREVMTEPEVRVNPVFLDRTMGIARATVLQHRDLALAGKRLQAADAFSSFTLDLIPSPGSQSEEFDLRLRAAERPKWSPWTLARGLAYETISTEFHNLGDRAIHAEASFRWDTNKKRVRTLVSGPLSESIRYRFDAGLRREIWDVEGQRLDVRRDELAAGLTGTPNGAWGWSSGARLLRKGGSVSVRYEGSASADVLRIPERRINVSAGARGDFGRTLSESSRIARGESGIQFQWRPRAVGEDYMLSTKAWVGRVWGDAEIDDLFALGLDRDTDFRLRGHRGVVRGKKGAGPIGKRYALWNTEFSKDLFAAPLLKTTLVPFVDIARAGSAFVDVGVELRINVASMMVFTISASHDVRAHRTVFFTNIVSR
jgi:hypothetical protein